MPPDFCSDHGKICNDLGEVKSDVKNVLLDLAEVKGILKFLTNSQVVSDLVQSKKNALNSKRLEITIGKLIIWIISAGGMGVLASEIIKIIFKSGG